MNTARKDDYINYINSSEWQAVRLKAFAHYGKKCTKCGSENLLHVHHNTYKNFKHEEMKDLNVLCEVCHMELHARINKRSTVKLGTLKVNKKPKNKNKNKSKKKKHKHQKPSLEVVSNETIMEKNRKAYDEMLLRKMAGLEKPVVLKPNKPKKPKKSKIKNEYVKVKTWLDVIQEEIDMKMAK